MMCTDEVAEWLRRWTANPLGSPRVGSNPILVEILSEKSRAALSGHKMHNIYNNSPTWKVV